MTAPRHHEDYYATTTTAGRSRRSPQSTSDYTHSSSLTFPDHTSGNSYSYHNYAQPRSSPDRPVYQASSFTGQYNYPQTSGAVELMYPHQYDSHLQSSAYSYDRRDIHSQAYPSAYSSSGTVYAPTAYPQGTDYMQYSRPESYNHSSSSVYEPHVASSYVSHVNSAQRGASRPESNQLPPSSGRRRTTSSATPYPPPPPTADLVEDSAVIKKKRRKADAAQLKVLNEVWERTAFPSTEERAELAKKLDMSPRSVQIWFQNRRQSMRQSMRQQSGTAAAGSQQAFAQIESPTEDYHTPGFNGYPTAPVSHSAHPGTSAHREIAPARSSTSPSSSSHRSASSRR